MSVLLGGWLLLFGMWPLADPGHSLGDGPLVVADLLLHGIGLGIVLRWRRHRAVEGERT